MQSAKSLWDRFSEPVTHCFILRYLSLGSCFKVSGQFIGKKLWYYMLLWVSHVQKQLSLVRGFRDVYSVL